MPGWGVRRQARQVCWPCWPAAGCPRQAPSHLPVCPPSLPAQVIHEGADPVQVVTENMSRPLKPEVDRAVAQAARGAEVPSQGDGI